MLLLDCILYKFNNAQIRLCHQKPNLNTQKKFASDYVNTVQLLEYKDFINSIN